MPKLTTEVFIRRSREVHDDFYHYHKSIYTGIDNKLIITCPDHGDFEQTPYVHMKGSGCKTCANIKTSKAVKQRLGRDFDHYRNLGHKYHGDKYDYSLVSYVSSETPVTIICPIHGEFNQTPYVHSKGHGCVRCAQSTERRRGRLPGFVGAGGGGRKAWNTERFIKSAINAHGNRYVYTNTVFVDMQTPVSILCREHGVFDQLPQVHAHNKSGCPSCGIIQSSNKRLKSETDFISDAIKIHGHQYDYTNVLYTGDKNHIEIICPRHGSFFQTPSNHLYNQTGCPKCSNSISKPANEWLVYMKVPDDPEHREVKGLIEGRRYVVDGFDPETNTVYEFWGDFHHGNPERYDLDDLNPKYGIPYSDLYNATIEKRKHIIDAGYNLIEIWETEWKRIKCELSELIPESKVD